MTGTIGRVPPKSARRRRRTRAHERPNRRSLRAFVVWGGCGPLGVSGVRVAPRSTCSLRYRFRVRLSVNSSGPAGSLAVMGARFIGCDRDQVFLMPPSVRDWVPEGHLVWTVLDAVAELDLSTVYADCAARGESSSRSIRGRPMRVWTASGFRSRGDAVERSPRSAD